MHATSSPPGLLPLPLLNILSVISSKVLSCVCSKGTQAPVRNLFKLHTSCCHFKKLQRTLPSEPASDKVRRRPRETPRTPPYLADQALCAAEEADTAGRDRIYVAYLNYSEVRLVLFTGQKHYRWSVGGSRAGTRVLARGCPCSLPSPPLPEASLRPRWGSRGENGPAHMMLAGVKTGPTHKVSVISQPQDRGLHTPSVSSSCSAGSSCPRSASQAKRDMA